MRIKRIIIVLVALVVGLSIAVWKWPNGQTDPQQLEKVKYSIEQPHNGTPAANSVATPGVDIAIPDVPGANLTQEDKKNIEKIVQVYSAPIEFWGKVLDQHGNAVPNVTVHYSVADKYFKDGSKYEGAGDAQGFFSIDKLKGTGLYVRVAKDGYYHIAEKSARSFGYGMPVGGTPPSKGNPAIFLLHKRGETEPLIKSAGTVRLPRDGTPTEITLRKERPAAVPVGQGDLRVEVWTDDANKDARRMYDWRCRVTVPGGGFIERTREFDFTAPIEGYVSTFEYAMKRGEARWINRVEREFFVQLKDGAFARLRFDLAAGGDHFVSLESYLNPKSGSRNLEFDSAKLATAPTAKP